MHPQPAHDAIFLGLRLYEWLTLLGVIAGPIAAVVISLWVERRRRTREQRLQVLRTLLNTRHLPADPGWSGAINLVPVEFNDCSSVMEAWKAYIDCVRYEASPENVHTHYEEMIAKQTTLIFRITRELGFSLPESDIRSSAYASRGFIERDDLYLNALRAWPRIAAALESQTVASE
jgi:hypothetical protein